MSINVARLPENPALHFILTKVFLDFCQLQGIIKRQSQPTIATREAARQHCPPQVLEDFGQVTAALDSNPRYPCNLT